MGTEVVYNILEISPNVKAQASLRGGAAERSAGQADSAALDAPVRPDVGRHFDHALKLAIDYSPHAGSFDRSLEKTLPVHFLGRSILSAKLRGQYTRLAVIE